ncbi:hypothetical protein L596_025588 [Steinernema carpocapsae]|uniref:Uncharacterized protein n=1 Tax=Steinernema carpocapsae TaxID=34508 RepID=A0A4U5M884_STECR|nr:hypothetical protein L596_025588 [Steinernema carpocapsae]
MRDSGACFKQGKSFRVCWSNGPVVFFSFFISFLSHIIETRFIVLGACSGDCMQSINLAIKEMLGKTFGTPFSQVRIGILSVCLEVNADSNLTRRSFLNLSERIIIIGIKRIS